MVLLPKALLRVRGEQADPRRAGRRGRAQGDDRRPGRRPQPLAAALAGRASSTSSRSASAALVREGDDATVVSYGRTLPLCVQAADELRKETRLDFDVIDLRSIFPYDWKAISASVQKTGRVLIVNEDTEVTNFGEHLLRRVIDEHFYDLLVRPAAAAAGQARAGHRAEPGLRAEHRAAAAGTQGGHAGGRERGGVNMERGAYASSPRWGLLTDRGEVIEALLKIGVDVFRVEFLARQQRGPSPARCLSARTHPRPVTADCVSSGRSARSRHPRVVLDKEHTLADGQEIESAAARRRSHAARHRAGGVMNIQSGQSACSWMMADCRCACCASNRSE